MMCVMNTEVCSTDQKYAVSKVTFAGCMNYMACIPPGEIPTSFKELLCSSAPTKGAAMVPGPHFVIDNTITTSHAGRPGHSLVSSIAAILSFVAAYILQL